ncbi:ATP-dependent helicase HrpB [Thiomicrorhabdus hydrogeniphila]
MQNLPITPYLPQILQTLHQQDVLVLQADPGAGKSTAVPLYLLENLVNTFGEQSGKILMLEPRRLAAKSIATYVAKQLNEPVGQTVGYQVRNESKTSKHTRLEIITEGILTSRIQSDPELTGVSLVIFDEFHERSIHADLGLTLCKDIRNGYNEALKLLVMSATINTQQISGFLNNAPVIESEGRCFEVATQYLTRPVKSSYANDWLPELMTLIHIALQKTQGDVLVFLPGQGEIKRCQNALQQQLNHLNVLVLPLYGALKAEQQQQALQKDKTGRQKVVLATNIAETSLTIENISAVVDSGFERVSTYDVTSGMSRLQTQRISLASANQRKGRAGRVQAGHCYRLWTESQQQALKPFAAEEITTTDLTALQLSLVQWGVKNYLELDWLTPPPQAHIDAAKNLLQRLELLNTHNGLTKKGQKAVKIGLEPRFSALLVSLEDESDSIKSMACDLVAVLTDSHFLHAPNDADLMTRLQALQVYRQNRQQAQKQYRIKPATAEQVLINASKLAKIMNVKQPVLHSLSDLQRFLGQLVAQSYPDRIAKRRGSSDTDNRYLLSNGKGAVLPELNELKSSAWLAVADLDGQRSDGRIYLATEIDLQTLQNTLGFETTAQYGYNAQSQKIVGKQQTKLGAILISETELAKPDKTQLKACLKQAIIDSDLSLLTWSKSLKAWLNKVRWLVLQNPQQTQDWPDFTLPGLVNSLEEWLIPYIESIDSIQTLKRVDITPLIQTRLPYEFMTAIDNQAPDFYVTPSGKKIKIDYSGSLPKVSVVLQEMFGELSSPKLAWGKINLAFELLSPAQRPIQTTSDLHHFWQNSYFEVAKEMRGRYPKHRWPEKPLQEKAGRSIKRKPQ